MGWFAADEGGRLYHIAELYGCKDTPNRGLRETPARIASRIREMEASHPLLRGRQIFGVADPSIFDESRGESIAVMMARRGVYWEAADNTRLAGKMQLHYRLAFDRRGVPMLYVFKDCKQFIRTFPSLVYDEHNPEDVDTAQEDHIYDMVRYVCMEHRISPPKKPARPAPGFDPLDLGW